MHREIGKGRVLIRRFVHKEDLQEAGAVAVYEDCAAILDSDFPE